MENIKKDLSVFLLGIGLVMTGCAIHFISDYDSVLDNDVTALQENTETFLNQLASETGTASTYNANIDFYSKTNASIQTMATRAASEPNSKIIVAEVQTLQNTFNDLQQLHKLNGDKGLSTNNIANTRSALESEFTSILTLELALKSGNSVPDTATAPTK